MLKLPSFISGFLVKRLAAGAAGGLGLIVGNEYAGHIAELLMDPQFIKQVFDWISGGLLLWAALARRDTTQVQHKLDEVEQTITEYLPKELDIDPYPGWDYDPIQGWVKSES